jgi:hypothetical protein
MSRERTVPPAATGSGTTDRVRLDRDGTPAVVLALEDLRACASDLGWTFEALATHLRAAGRRVDRAYVHRVLHGDKPCGLAWLLALPADLRAAFYSRLLERLGSLVVAPLDPESARRAVVAGLCALLGPALPAKAGAPLRASLNTVTLGAPRAAGSTR